MIARPRSPSQAQAARGLERLRRAAKDRPHPALGRGAPPSDGAFRRRAGLDFVGTEFLASNGRHVLVQQPGIERTVNQGGHVTGCMEVVHVHLPVRVYPVQQRHRLRQFYEVVPGQVTPAARAMAMRWGGDRSSSRGVLPHDAVDEGAFVRRRANRRAPVAGGGQRQRAAGRFLGKPFRNGGAPVPSSIANRELVLRRPALS